MLHTDVLKNRKRKFNGGEISRSNLLADGRLAARQAARETISNHITKKLATAGDLTIRERERGEVQGIELNSAPPVNDGVALSNNDEGHEDN